MNRPSRKKANRQWYASNEQPKGKEVSSQQGALVLMFELPKTIASSRPIDKEKRKLRSFLILVRWRRTAKRNEVMMYHTVASARLLMVLYPQISLQRKQCAPF